MSFDLGAIRDGIKATLATIDGLRCYDIIPDSDLVVPAAVVQPVTISHKETYGRGPVYCLLRVTLFTSAGSDRVGQDTLDALLSAGTGQTTSVIDAIEADPTLGGSVDSSGIDPDSEIDYGKAEVNGVIYWKADVHIKTLRSRS